MRNLRRLLFGLLLVFMGSCAVKQMAPNCEEKKVKFVTVVSESEYKANVAFGYCDSEELRKAYITKVIRSAFPQLGDGALEVKESEVKRYYEYTYAIKAL